MQIKSNAPTISSAMYEIIHNETLNEEQLTTKGWSNRQLAKHFYLGNGRGLTLSQIGLLQAVRQEADRIAISRRGGFKDQIRREVARVKNRTVYKSFHNSYSFSGVRFAFGGGKLSGNFAGQATQKTNSMIEFSGKISVKYSDKFVDPLSIVEFSFGNSESSNTPGWLRGLSNFGGTPYPITGSWSESFTGKIGIA